MSEGFSIESEESSNSSSASYPGSKEREIVSDFISNMFEEERENQDKKIVGNFIDSLLEEEKPKTNMKKINNKRSKNKVVKNYLPSNKKQKNSAKNNKKNNNIIQDNSQEKTIDTNMYRNTLIKKILNINKHKNNYERNKSTEIRQKNININLMMGMVQQRKLIKKTIQQRKESLKI